MRVSFISKKDADVPRCWLIKEKNPCFTNDLQSSSTPIAKSIRNLH